MGCLHFGISLYVLWSEKKEAKWEDLPRKHFLFDGIDWRKYPDLRAWSDNLNLFDNWANLSAVLTIASNFETYLASVVALALESDPGVLIGAPKTIDGAKLLKHGKAGVFHAAEYVDACTRGDWSARLDAFERMFGRCSTFRESHAQLEDIRLIRNRFGHAFGRDIDQARLPGTLKKLPMENLSREKAQNLREKVLTIVKSVDRYLLENHMGDYEAVRFYSKIYPDLHKHVNKSQRAVYLKKQIGQFGAIPRGKIYCKGLVDYWEGL
jgi:hypothetical protein